MSIAESLYRLPPQASRVYAWTCVLLEPHRRGRVARWKLHDVRQQLAGKRQGTARAVPEPESPVALRPDRFCTVAAGYAVAASTAAGFMENMRIHPLV